MREKPAFLENGFQGGEEHVDWGCLGVGRGPHRHFLLFSMCCRRSGFVCCAPGRRHPRVPVAREDRERRQSWCCRGRRRGVGVGGEEPVPSSSRAVGLGGACSPAGVGQFAERPHAAGLSVLARGWDSWSGRCSHCTDGREVGACIARRGSRLGGAGGLPGVAGARGGESHVSQRRRRRWGGGESLWPGADAAPVLGVRLCC